MKEFKIFHAELKGSSIPEGVWEGRLQSIHSKALNILHSSKSFYISIVDSIEQMSGYALVIPDFNSLLSEMSDNCRFSCTGTSINFPDGIIDITPAALWRGTSSSCLCGAAVEIADLKRAYFESASVEGLSSLITCKSGNIYSNTAGELIAEAVNNSILQNELLVDLSPIIGLGPGFTPSGDDFIAGIMLYEGIFSVRILKKESIRLNLSGTTLGGRTLLMLALRNSFPFYLKEFIVSVYEDHTSLSNAVEKALLHGSTSGSDSLAGFLWAAERNTGEGQERHILKV